MKLKYIVLYLFHTFSLSELPVLEYNIGVSGYNNSDTFLKIISRIVGNLTFASNLVTQGSWNQNWNRKSQITKYQQKHRRKIYR